MDCFPACGRFFQNLRRIIAQADRHVQILTVIFQFRIMGTLGILCRAAKNTFHFLQRIAGMEAVKGKIGFTEGPVLCNLIHYQYIMVPIRLPGRPLLV